LEEKDSEGPDRVFIRKRNPVHNVATLPLSRTAVETQFSTGWYWPILRLMTTGLHNATSPSCTQDTFPHSRDAFPRSRLVCIVAHLCISPHIFTFHHASSRSIAHLRVPSRIFAFHRASSCIFAFHRASSRFTAHLRVSLRIFAFHRTSSHSIAHIRVSSRFSAHHRRSIHPLSSQFLGASHSVYYYI
jgi:hypothetical protein